MISEQCSLLKGKQMSKKLSAKEKERKVQRRLEKAAEKKKKTISAFIRVTSIIVASVTLLCFVIWGSVTVFERYTSSNKYQSKFTAISSEHFTVNNAMMVYYYYDGYYGFVDYYSSSLSEYGLDEDAPLDKIAFDPEQGIDTWHDYFVQSAVEQTKELIILAESGIRDGVTLTDAEKDALRIRADGYDLTKYPGATADDIYNALLLSASGMKYSGHLTESFLPSVEDAEEEYQSYPKYYQTVDHRLIDIPYGTEEGDFSQSEATEIANRFKDCTSSDEFTAVLTEILNDEEYGFAESSKELIHQNSFASGITYSQGEIMSEWLFDSERKAGDVRIYDNEGSSIVSAYMVTTPAKRDESETRTVRHILFRSDTWGGEEAAAAKAEEVLAQFNSSDRDAQSFGELALAYSEDAGSAYVGGIYKNFKSGTMVQQFDEWCFDTDRKPGDTAVVNTTYGAHIIYYVSKGDTSYIADVKSDVAGAKYQTESGELSKNITVTVDDSALDKLKSARGGIK